MYLAVNLTCLIVLVRRQYTRIWPAFVLFQSLTCWQATVRLFVNSPRSWQFAWAPGEMVLLAVTIAAVGEVLWKSLKQIGPYRLPTFASLLVGCYCLAAWAVDLQPGSWYAQFLIIRTQIFLAMAMFSFFGFWAALWFNPRWPRVGRMHACMVAVLMAAHVVIVDWSRWQWSNLEYRAVQMLCCAGWIINANFLDADLGQLVRIVQRAAVLPSHDQPAVPLGSLPILALPNTVGRAGFGVRGHGSSAGPSSGPAEKTITQSRN